MATEDYRVLHEVIKGRRKRMMLTQQEVADLIGMTKGAISRIENGRHRPYPSTIRKIAKALESDWNEFVEWESVEAPPVDPGLSEKNETQIGDKRSEYRRRSDEKRNSGEEDSHGSGDRD